LLSKRTDTLIRIFLPLPTLLAVLYLELLFGSWYPASQTPGALFLLTALVGGMVWAWLLPHPRQERKRREALLKAQGEQDKAEAGYTND
jgi:hypothetical protein